MEITNLTYVNALSGGVLIGLASVILMLCLGRIAGISGILANLLSPTFSANWQWFFIAGLFSSGVITHYFIAPLAIQIEANSLLIVISGLLVGIGTRIGSGCTSGHGVCGISRFSPRSITATAVFMSTAMITVFLMKQV